MTAAMASERHPYLNGRFTPGDSVVEIRSPWDEAVVSRVSQASLGQIEEAITLGVAARSELAAQAASKRYDLCAGIARQITERAEEMAQVICAEAGKPIGTARTEVRRAATTFELAAAETREGTGEALPMDLAAAFSGYQGLWSRFPKGLVVGISPFNFPLNLAAHKVAPALAVGAPIVLKPPPQAPSAALLLAEMAQRAGAHPGALAVLPCGNDRAEKLATDPRVRLVSFTGSAKVGWALKAKAARAEVVLELGGNAAAIVAADADLPWAIERLGQSAFGYAGQVCISVQRVFAQRAVYEQVVSGLSAFAERNPPADPRNDTTLVGPVIDLGAGKRIEAWLAEAAGAGAVVRGGARSGNRLSPAVVTAVPRQCALWREEVFGPVVAIAPYESLDEAIAGVNDSDYGLQAAIFTRDLGSIRRAYSQVEVGGLIANDSPSFRADSMPYGGMKSSGMGREGVRHAMRAYSEPKVLVLR
jgi:acyl-CoA reductase-like NAD-dependent aldehyde dehydrogenase